MFIFSPFPRVLSYESPKATMQTKHKMVCTFKKIKNVHQLLIINPKRYILLHSNQATHLQCDSLRFRGRVF